MQPPEWMSGVWSSRNPDPAAAPATIVSYLYIEEDRVDEVLQTCGSEERTSASAYSWTSVEPDAIEITDVGDAETSDRGESAYVVFRGACEQFDGVEAAYLVDALDGRELLDNRGMWVRGEVCMGPIDTFGVCSLSWCDGEPPQPLPCE
jgi:hypothetical protein